MKKTIASLLFLFAIFAAQQRPALAQSKVIGQRTYTVRNTTPDIGIGNIGSGIGWHRITWNTLGTVSACSVTLQQSTNNTIWTTLIGPQVCTSTGMSVVVMAVVNYIRIDPTSFTGTAGSTVVVHWDGFDEDPAASGGGTVTGITTTGPIVGGPITVTGDISCPTCVTSTAPGIGIAHFAGGTQNVTSSPVNLAGSDVTGQLPIGNVGSTGLIGTAPISIAATGAISCTTCNTSGATIAGSIASPQVAFGSGANTISGDNTFEFNSTTKAVSIGTAPGGFANEGYFNLFGTFPTGSDCDGIGTHCQDYRVVTGNGANGCPYLRLAQDSADATARMNGVAMYEFYCKNTTYSDYSMQVAGATALAAMELRNNGFAQFASSGGTGGNMNFILDSPNSRFDFVGQPVRAPAYTTSTNCTDSAGAAACGSAAAGAFVVDAGATTVVVSTTAVTANSEIFVADSPYLNTRLGVTCNTTIALPTVTAISAGVSFTVTIPVAPITNRACYVYNMVN